MNAGKELADLLAGREYVGRRCPACATRLGNRSVADRPPPGIKGIGFDFNGCGGCGHLFRVLPDGTARDLTRDEADRIAAQPFFAEVRRVVEVAVGHLKG